MNVLSLLGQKHFARRPHARQPSIDGGRSPTAPRRRDCAHAPLGTNLYVESRRGKRVLTLTKLQSHSRRWKLSLPRASLTPTWTKHSRQSCVRMKAEGVTRSKFLRMTDLAKRVGLLSQYENMNKVCSKFVDPTSWNLFTGDDGPTRFPYASELFFLYGAKYLAIVFAEVRPHILKYGLRHKS